MDMQLNYGKKNLAIEIEPDWDITLIKKSEMPVIANPVQAVNDSLSNGVHAAALLQEAAGCKSACILICDITRPVPNHLILGPILRCLLEGGLRKENITILVATGLHRPNQGEELEELVGDPWVLENFTVENHFAEDDSAHLNMGLTGRGTPVKIDQRFVDSDLRIVTGLVEPHFMAGFSGGRKVIAPGIAHQDTIKTFHNFRFMSDPNVNNCILDDNPLHLEQLEIVKKIGKIFAVNTVLDEERRLSFINYGEIIESHLDAVKFVEQFIIQKIDRKFDILVTSAAGYPLDKTYYQTVKGMIGPLDILTDGGDLIVVSACSEGLGSNHFVEAQKRLVTLGDSLFLSEIKSKTFADIDEWQTQMQIKATSSVNVHLFTEGLTEKEKNLTGVNIIDSVEGKIRQLMSKKYDKRLAIIPEGPYIVPKYVPSD